MRFFIFKLRLLVLLGIFLVQLALGSFWQLRSTLAMFVLALAVLISSFLQVQNSQILAQNEQVIPLSLPVAGSSERPLTRTAVQNLLAQYEKISSQEPLHRDVLLNMAVLYSTLGETERAQTKWDQARKLDPNHPAFTQ